MSMPSKEWIKNLPKAELHMHLEGSLEPDLKLQLAEKNQIDIGQNTIEEIQKTYQFNSLPSFLNIYYSALQILQHESDFYALASEYLKKAKENQVRHAELFFDPQAHTSRGIAFETVINGYYQACLDAASYGVDAKLIMCILRDFSVESAEQTYQEALKHREKIIGIGLDSDEFDNPPNKFYNLFQQAKKNGFKITIHCDVDQKNSIEHIRQALQELHTDRIDHGTNIVEDKNLVAYVKEKEIGFTSCPLSNGFITSDMKGAEIIHLLENGVKITVNSDDPAYFQGYVSDNLYALASKFSLTKKQIIQLIKNSFEISWISKEDKDKYIKELEEAASCKF